MSTILSKLICKKQTNDNIKQILIQANENEKLPKLHQLLQQISGSIVIFLDTKRGVDNLTNYLNDSNYNVVSIHGDKKQYQRQAAIGKFTNGEVPILIATDVASRGLDFPSVSYVFNYDMPKNIDDYIHRIGRTGRCGKSGIAISFLSDNNKTIVKPLYDCLSKQNQEIPKWFNEMYFKVKNDKFQPYTHKNNFKNKNNDFGNGDNRSSNNSFLQRKRQQDGSNDRQDNFTNNKSHYSKNQSSNADYVNKQNNTINNNQHFSNYGYSSSINGWGDKNSDNFSPEIVLNEGGKKSPDYRSNKNRNDNFSQEGYKRRKFDR